MTKEDYEISDYLSNDALSNFELDNDSIRWLEKYSSLYQSICKLQKASDTKPIMLFGIKFYLQLGSFYSKYEKLMRDHEFTIKDL